MTTNPVIKFEITTSQEVADRLLRDFESRLRSAFKGVLYVARSERSSEDKKSHLSNRVSVTSEGDVYKGRAVYEGGILKVSFEMKEEGSTHVYSNIADVVKDTFKE